MAERRNRRTPKSQRRLKKFDGGERLASFGANQAGDAAGEIVVGLEVRHDQFLRWDDRSRNRKQPAVRTHVHGSRMLPKGLIAHSAVKKDLRRGANATAPPLFQMQDARILPPVPKTEPAPKHLKKARQDVPQLKNISPVAGCGTKCSARWQKLTPLPYRVATGAEKMSDGESLSPV